MENSEAVIENKPVISFSVLQVKAKARFHKLDNCIHFIL